MGSDQEAAEHPRSGCVETGLHDAQPQSQGQQDVRCCAPDTELAQQSHQDPEDRHDPERGQVE